jgi:hypothetical protein
MDIPLNISEISVPQRNSFFNYNSLHEGIMRKFLYNITPSFIRSFDAYLLKNAPLGWQLQLPTITWSWFLITLITLPIPFLVKLDNTGDDDIIGVILIAVLTAVLEAFLFVYILIQFNVTKTFGKRVVLNGFKEQLAYLYVFLLCMLHIIFYPLIVDVRKSKLMTDEEIRNEAVIYNQASFYFMGKEPSYRYFPSDSSFLHYEFLEQYGYAIYREANGNAAETYYIERVKPAMRNFFLYDSEMIDSKYTRDVIGCPKLYLTEDNYITEVYYNYNADGSYKPVDTLYFETYQLQKKTDAERLRDISAFLKLYKKYSYNYSDTYFDSPEETLNKYKSNRFSPVVTSMDGISRDYPVTTVDGELEAADNSTQVDGYRISEVHSTISEARYRKWHNVFLRFIIAFHVALCFSVLLFLFKNTRLREFILMFVYTGLLALAVIILTVVFSGKEDFGIHVVLLVFLTGIYFSFLEPKAKHFSSLKTIFVLVSNATFAYAPLFFFLYFYEYMEVGKLDYEYCNTHQQLCDERRALADMILYSCIWGGIAFYILLGSTLYKKTYERFNALPLAK